MVAVIKARFSFTIYAQPQKEVSMYTCMYVNALNDVNGLGLVKRIKEISPARGIMNRLLSLCSNVPFLRDIPMMFVDPQGLKYYAKLQDYWRFVKPFEPLTHEFLASYSQRGDVFIDVGAHVGIYTIKLAQFFSKVIALEPEPQNYSLLYKNVSANGLSDKVIALPVAASDRDGYADLYVKAPSGAHSLEDSRGARRKVKVITMKIDTLLRVLNVEKVDVVKIDVEGHENRVIIGMNELLKRRPPKVLVIETRKDNNSLRETLCQLGYKITVLDCWNFTCNYGFYRE